jgi:6,7-dimethyl-8-ribityllumazine synthase
MANAPRILIVTSRYYAHISAELEAGVVEGLEKVGATYEFLEVPGAFEIPAAIAMAIENQRVRRARMVFVIAFSKTQL